MRGALLVVFVTVVNQALPFIKLTVNKIVITLLMMVKQKKNDDGSDETSYTRASNRLAGPS